MRYAVGVAETMGLRTGEIDVIRRAAMVHDIGKIGVPDNILRKPGPLTEDERLVMQQHPLIGAGILDQMRFLERELPIVRHHHERWDGRGYPDRLAETTIPLGARVLAVADCFDAITSDRVYRRSRCVPEALQTLADEAGAQFDPAVVEAMLRWVEAIIAGLPAGREPTPGDLLGACEVAAA
jgi:HD-GYP domain-containing protein (c-di-GMP phosphodiesterase class II)